ncbi:hypothetical protein RJZ90_006820 [Blastomyces dermatitidis]
MVRMYLYRFEARGEEEIIIGTLGGYWRGTGGIGQGMAAANWHAADWSHKRIKQGHILPRRTSLSLAFGIGNHSGNLRNEWERWSDPTPNEVYVTGTFDNWARSVKLDRTEDGFRKDVAVPIVGGKLLYKNANALFMRWGSPYDVIFNSPMISPVAS